MRSGPEPNRGPLPGRHCPGCHCADNPNLPFKTLHFFKLVDGHKRYWFRKITVSRKISGGYLAVVAATDTEAAAPVVVFGAGPTFGAAWEAANQGVGKGSWKPDQFPGLHWQA